MACSLVQTIDPSECVGNSLSKINSNFSNLQTNVCNLLASTNIPIGGIIMYSGLLTNFNGSGMGASADVISYGLCNGNWYNNNTIHSPDLRGRFVIGQGTGVGIDNTGTYTQGLTGGKETIILTTPEIPSHAHVDPYSEGTTTWTAPNGTVYNWPTVPNTAGAPGSLGGTDYDQSLNYTGATGGGQAHDNMPPWFALAYIIRVI